MDTHEAKQLHLNVGQTTAMEALENQCHQFKAKPLYEGCPAWSGQVQCFRLDAGIRLFHQRIVQTRSPVP